MEIREIAQRLTESALKEGFDEAITLVKRRDTVMAKIFNSELSVVQRWNTTTIGLYLTKDKRIFIVSLEPSDLSEVRKSIKELISIASQVQESPLYAPIPKVEEVTPLSIVDKAIVNYMDKIDNIVERLIEVSHREKIDNVAGMIQLSYEERALATSTTISANEYKTWIVGYIRAFAEDGSGQWSYTSTKLNINGLEDAALTASRLAVESKGRSDVEPGCYDLILSPMVFGNLINYVVEMASAFSVITGTSIFMKRTVGDRVASEKFSVYDMPRDEDLPNAVGFDDESINTFNKPVIENGVLKTLLHNTKTAHIMKTATTGNAGWVNPKPWNIVVGKGDATLDEMIAEVKKGLIITNNWYTRLQNYIEGEFSTIARDAIFLVENGRIVKSVNRIRIADTFNNILNNIDMVGRELYNIHWWEVSIPIKLPYVLIRNIRTSKHII